MSGSPEQLTPGVRQGDLLAGKYRVDRILGAGGMGVVVAAHHVELEERVAVKFLLPDALSNPEAAARFAREARAAVKIKSEHIARVTDVGKLETGAPYMVMEYLEGEDLGAWLAQKGRLPVEQAIEFVLQALEAVAEAHGLGIVHRDLKPANMFCIRLPDGQLSIKVLDFGISKLTGPGASGSDVVMTRTTAVMGSPLYMSPEQLHSARDVDARTDIWSMGVTLYELVAGQPPFAGDSLVACTTRILSSTPPSLCGLRHDAPRGLEHVIQRCLEKDPTKRFANVAELANALLEFGPTHARASVERISRVMQRAGLSAASLSLPPSSVAEAETAAGTQASCVLTARAKRPSATKLAGAGLIALCVVGAAAFVVARRARTPSVAATTFAPAPSLPSPPVHAAARAASEPVNKAPDANRVSVVPRPSAASITVVPAVATTPDAGATAARLRAPRPHSKPSSEPLTITTEPSAAKPARKPECRPNFYLDSEGQKHFKPECFQ